MTPVLTKSETLSCDVLLSVSRPLGLTVLAANVGVNPDAVTVVMPPRVLLLRTSAPFRVRFADEDVVTPMNVAPRLVEGKLPPDNVPPVTVAPLKVIDPPAAGENVETPKLIFRPVLKLVPVTTSRPAFSTVTGPLAAPRLASLATLKVPAKIVVPPE
jgi:hypothetical protein